MTDAEQENVILRARITQLDAERRAIEAALLRYRDECLPGVWLALNIWSVLNPEEQTP